MGRKGNWFNAMKKALHSNSKEKSSQEPGKSKKKWFRKKKRTVTNTTPSETVPTSSTMAPQDQTLVPPEPAKLSGADKEQTKHAYTVALATAKTAEAAVAAAEAAAEVVRLTTTATQFAGKSKEEVAAIKIQTAFRGYMARRALRALQGLMRLKIVIQGQAVKRQTKSTLKSMQTLARLQSQIRERRLKMAEENQARQSQIQHQHAKEQAKELEKSPKNGDGWDSSRKTKEQIESTMQSKHEAAIRRERTLAYAYTHQQPWKASSRSANTLFMDSNNPHWGWSWLERWLAARPWETATLSDKEFSNHSSPRVKTSPKSTTSGNVNEITKSYASRHHDTKKLTAVTKQTRSSSNNTARLSTSSTTTACRKLKSQSPRTSIWGAPDDDARSMSEHSRRNSTANYAGSVSSSVSKDDEIESLASSHRTAPSYMAPTESAKARSRLASESKTNRPITPPDRLSISSAKKRLSYTPSPARSRRSTSSLPDAVSLSEHT